MKACILAGGLGTRLRPLTSFRPKPMMPLFDRPVMEYTLALLKSQGVEECMIPLLYLPEVIRGYFGDEYDGIRLRYAVEEKPVGSAGSILAFGDALTDDDFLIVSGDAVFDMDLRRAVLFHRERKASATIVLSRAKDPTAFGSVLTDEDGVVTGFLEKPAWESVSTGRVNTGIYVLSRGVLDRIPRKGEVDFSLDLFPLLLREKSLCGIELPGYWRDMGTPESYLEAMRDGMNGAWAPSIPPAGADAPKNVAYRPPCYFSPGASAEEGAVIGPFASIERGAFVGKNSSVSHSAVFGKIGEGTIVTGSIVDRGARVGDKCVLSPLSVVGEGAVIGSGSHVGKGVHVLCDAVLENGTEAGSERDLQGLSFHHRLTVFSGRAVLSRLSDAALLADGVQAAFGKRISLSADPRSHSAVVFSDALQAEACALGADVFRHDGGTSALAAYMTRLLSVSAGIFLAGTPGGSVETILFGKEGVRLTPKESRFPLRRMEPEIGTSPGKTVFITGAEALYVAEGARDPIEKNFVVYSRDPVMRAFLGNAGVSFADKAEGFPVFSCGSGGHSLELVSEKGYAFTPDEVILLTLQALYTLGKEMLAVPSDAPSACESLASDLGKSLLRVGRDREAEALYASEPALHHAPFAALALIRALLKTGKTLSAFSASVPASVSVLRDYRAEGDRIDLMERFADGLGGMKCDRSDGVRIFMDGASLSLRLSPYERLLTLKAESPNEETSAELCDFYFNRLSELERGE